MVKKDAADVDLINTALRETEEEIGVSMDKVKVVGALSELYIIASNFNVLPSIGYLNEAPDFKPDEHEVDEIISVKIEDLMDNKLQKEKPLYVVL